MTTTKTTTANATAALWAAHGGFRDIFDLAGAAINALENGSVESAKAILITLVYRADLEGDAADLAYMFV